ncbi:MAG TPA: hypothetical protein VFJ58_11140 [Armatimonadota bacterium]|nr:hypothetical protein [Armatimonadota bacterium]
MPPAKAGAMAAQTIANVRAVVRFSMVKPLSTEPVAAARGAAYTAIDWMITFLHGGRVAGTEAGGGTVYYSTELYRHGLGAAPRLNGLPRSRR